MATTYALPPMNGHGVSGGQGHSHSRKSATQRISLQSTSINGGYYLNGGPMSTDFLKSHLQHQPTKSIDVFYESPQQRSPVTSTLQLPTPTSFSTPTNARSKSMERRKSVGLPTHLRLQNDGYGFPGPSQKLQQSSTEKEKSPQWLTSTEAFSSILVPLPYVLASLAYRSLIATQLPEDTLPLSSVTISQAPRLPMMVLMTSIILVLVGLKGKVGGTAAELDRRKGSLVGVEKVQKTRWDHLARRIIGRFLTVGLPFYATSTLGGVRVGLVMLVALASNIMVIEEEAADFKDTKVFKRLLGYRWWTIGAILLQLVSDYTGLTNSSAAADIMLGYVALGVSIFVLPPSFRSSRPKVSLVTSSPLASESSTSAVLTTPWETPPQLDSKPAPTISPLICSPEDVNLTLWSGTVLGILSVAISLVFGLNAGVGSPTQLAWSLLCSFAAALALTITEPRSLRNNKRLGLVVGPLISCFLFTKVHSDPWSSVAYQSVLVAISFVATSLDTPNSQSNLSHSDHGHQQKHSVKLHSSEHAQMSRFSEFVIHRIQHWPLLHSILAEKDSRRIFYFMCLNFVFMIVQTFYGLLTGSLGLLSDSIHMFFDCIALVVGLCAAVMSKWPPSTRFPYGYGKMDTLAGFANGIFLMLISIEIVYEAIERLLEGKNINKLGELLTVSTLGLLVNLIGMTAFGHAHHGHGHSHSGHDQSDHSHAHRDDESDHSHLGHSHNDHSHHDHPHRGSTHRNHSHHEHSHHDHSHHDHSHHDHSPSKPEHPPQSAHGHGHLHDHLSTGTFPSPSIYSSVRPTPSKLSNPLVHDHNHKSHNHAHHHHGNENMHGIFLHVMADTLGSVAVVISTLLIHFFGWSGFDPLASCLIAILIFASAIPLVTSSARTLLLTVPDDTEYDLREALAGLSALRGIVGYAVPKFWLEEGEGKVLGVIHVIAGKGTDLEDVKERAIAFLKGRHLDVVVQVEREGTGCWCRAVK